MSPSGAHGTPVSVLAAAAAAGLLVFLGLGMLVDADPLLPGDRAAFDVADGLRWAPAVDVVSVLTDVGALPVVAAVVVVTALFVRPRSRGLALIAALAILWLVVGEAKGYFGRPRPEGQLEPTTGEAYPSGHAAYATAWLACAVATGRGRWLIAAGAAVLIAVMVSRVYLHVHYLSDTLGGAALGVAVFAACGLAARGLGAIRENGR